jgi:DNA-binding NarL/FixJ family response regulator
MVREQALTQPENRYVKAGEVRAQRRDIFYLDAQALTRDCIAHELARRLPDFNILEHALVQDLIASEDSRLHTAAVAILNVHAERFGHHVNAEPGTSSVATELNVLEQVAPAVPRVLLSEVEGPEHIWEAFRQRVRGYVPTTLPIDQVAEAIRFVAAGGTFVPQGILSLHTRPNPPSQGAPASPDLSEAIAQFSPRQTQVLRMLWKGSSNKLIANELRMCESTVNMHLRHIMKKLNASNRTQVVLKTRRQLLDDNRAISAS